MKGKIIKIILLILFIFLQLFNLSAQEIKDVGESELKKMSIKPDTDPGLKKKEKDKKLKVDLSDDDSLDEIRRLAFDFQPLGFLFYGPMINFGFRAGISNAVVEFHIRAAAFGLTYNAVKSEWNKVGKDTNKVGFETIYFGPGFKYFFDIKKSPNKGYVGSVIEFGFGSVDGDVGSNFETESEFYDFVFMVNGGYRWRFQNGFFLNLGAYIGFAYTFKETWWYLNTPADKYDVSGDFAFVGQMELAIGFEF